MCLTHARKAMSRFRHTTFDGDPNCEASMSEPATADAIDKLPESLSATLM